jgi:7SK snRNA methylphosphate capping enzyme
MKYFGNYLQTKDARSHDDIRLPHLSSDYFTNRNVLDLGCGDGSIAIEIAIKMFPAKIVLLDIDSKLLHQARRSVNHFIEMNKKYQ